MLHRLPDAVKRDPTNGIPIRYTGTVHLAAGVVHDDGD